MATSSSSSASSSSSSDSLNGLKFGQKIYFEAAAAGGSQPAERPPPVPANKKGRPTNVSGGGGGGSQQQQHQPPRCRVEGCKIDLSDAKPYYSRHKVCGAHSKSPKVIVAGLEQRFCQQCSRFHQLAEFDQGKRSCRRRLAGHNERRRKPPPGSLSTRYVTLSSSFFETNSRAGSFLMDFSTYPGPTGRDSWPHARASEQAMCNQLTATGKFLQHPWQSNLENPPSELLLDGSAARTTYAGSGIFSGECFAGVSDSSCALSLLSTHPPGSKNQSSSLGVNCLINANGTTPFGMVQPSGSHGEAINHLSSPLWGYKGGETNSGSCELPPDLGLGQFSQPVSSQYSGNFDASQQSGREFLGLEHSRGYDSSLLNMHWSL
ncbi:hypothetical protein ACH5RR_002664 [Cinchona calisaya]|uniref:SBP-type domain-containing protein n=1 Tax=Cinchona calisaya TaxID=153742 RepID=A0ABD3ASL4_9GENT